MFSHLAVEAVSLSKRFSAADAANFITRRATEGGSSGSDDSLPVSNGLMALFVVGNLLLFLPLLFFISYTLSDLIPTLAVVEDDCPPAYERVSNSSSLQDEFGIKDGQEGKIALPLDDDNVDSAAAGSSSSYRPVTSSLRSTLRALKAVGGWPSLFRGLGLNVAAQVVTAVVAMILTLLPFVPAFVAVLASSLICTPLYTAWVHAVVSTPGSFSYRRALGSGIGRTYRAATLPTLALWGSVVVSHAVPVFLFHALGLSGGADAKSLGRGDAAKALVVIASAVVLNVALVLPSHMVLTRVQASLLPADCDTIIPLDRTFGQADESSSAAAGRGYLSVAEAFRSVTRASVVRMVKIYARIFLATFGLEMLVALFLVAQIAFFSLFVAHN
ncbi:hypothetical protein F4778DRAFT_290069 [Xylariomycetidae sp. FL2044]|nr:hypothetical protein F4778DRAFT_290069 [Xylariomycetidae sp. FL2044]